LEASVNNNQLGQVQVLLIRVNQETKFNQQQMLLKNLLKPLLIFLIALFLITKNL